MSVKFFTKQTLVAANREAIRTKRNRTLDPTLVESLDADGLKFPIGTTIHNDSGVRVNVGLGRWTAGGTPEFVCDAWLDVPFETFNSLPSIETAREKTA